jgi:hypothetical protein
MKLDRIKVEHIWAVVFFTVGLLMLSYFAFFGGVRPLARVGPAPK